MGTCVASKRFKTESLDRYQHQPTDILEYKDKILPKLAFQATLAQVKCKNCPYKAISMRITLDQVQSFELTPKDITIDGSAKWKIQHKMGFQMTEYQLRKRFLTLQFFNQVQELVGKLRINLYLISTGPCHQDFAINFIKNSTGRVSFDFRISQIIELKLESIMTQIQLIKKHPGQKFHFSIKSIIDNNSLISLHSYTVSVLLDNKQINQIVEPVSDPNQLRKSKKRTVKLAEKQIQEGKNLVWQKQKCLQLPSLAMKIQASQLHHACFQILLCKITDKNQKEGIQQKPQLYAQCYISFQKLFLTDYTIIQRDGHKLQQRSIYVQEKLWNHGKQVALGKFKFYITNQKYIKQMQVCVRTQRGILKSSPVFSESKCQQITQLLKISQQIESKVIELEKYQSEGGINFQIRNIHLFIQKNLKKIIPLLQKSTKQSVIIFNYSSPTQLEKAQTIFIGIGMKIITYLEEEDPQINQICWSILISLLRRGQFMLCHIGFDDNQKKLISQDKINQNLRKRMDIALMYQEFLYKLLEKALKSLNAKGLDCQRSFAEIFCAYAYFRIPLFRNQILDAICHEDDPEIMEWRGIQFNLNQDINYEQIKQDVNTFTILFDWSNGFHKCLQKQEKYQSNHSQLIDILLNDDWRSRMNKRGSAFFYFVRYWVKYVQQIAVKSKDIQWKYFPGYNRLIRSFLVQMKLRSILQYPDAIKQTCASLLANEKLLNPFVAILINKGNIFEPLTVLKVIQLIGSLFEFLSKRKKMIPYTFNYIQFFKAIKRILEQSQFSYAISQVLALIYTHFNLFNMEFKRNISMYLLGKVFFKLFLHWSNNVRLIFCHLITMRIFHQSHIIHSIDNQNENCRYKHKYNQQIKIRYQKLITIAENAQKKKHQDGKKYISSRYQKQLFKKMRKKNYQRRRKRQNGSIQEQRNLQQSRVNSDKNTKATGSLNFKYSINELTKPKMERSQSEITIKPSITVALRNIKENKKQQVVRINKSNSLRYSNQILDTTQNRLDSRRIQSNYLVDETDFQIYPFTTDELVYIEASLRTFNQVNNSFIKYVNQKKSQPPLVKMEMPIDERQFRPDKIDDW